jgi:hypothetical protein
MHGSFVGDYQRVSFFSNVVHELPLSSELSLFVPHFLLRPRQTPFAFLFSAIPTPLWLIEAECRNTFLLANGKDEKGTTLITGYGLLFHFVLQQEVGFQILFSHPLPSVHRPSGSSFNLSGFPLMSGLSSFMFRFHLMTGWLRLQPFPATFPTPLWLSKTKNGKSLLFGKGEHKVVATVRADNRLLFHLELRNKIQINKAIR